MVETLQNLQVVYAKWQDRSPYSQQSAPGSCTVSSKQNGVLPPGRVGNGDAGGVISAGQQAWRVKYGNNIGPPPPRRVPKQRTGHGRRDHGFATANYSTVQNCAENLAWFKKQPVVQPVAVRHRPFSVRCCDCMPDSRNSLYSDNVKSAGVHDILRVETRYSSQWWTRTFYHTSFVMQKRLEHHFPDVSLAVITSPRVVQAIRLSAQDNDEDIEPALIGKEPLTSTGKEPLTSAIRQRERRVKHLLQRIKAVINNRLTRFTGWFLHKLFGQLLSSIIVHKGQMAMLQQACKQELPVIFLPTHRSHLDYILITFILFNYDIRSPHVAAGENLLIPFFGALMRGLGGFFIRRKLDRVPGKKDHIYRAVLYTYMEELLRNGESLEFFVEGGRTRSGKPLPPKGGLLSVVVDSLSSGVIEDAYIVPVSISYDRLVDGNFVREQMGEPKVYETFWRAVMAIYRVLMGYYGVVRVDFAQPFSLREYTNVYKFYPGTSHQPSLSNSGTSLLTDSFTDNKSSASLPTDSSVVPIRQQTSSNSLDASPTGENRQLVHSLAEHVIYASANAVSVMSPHILALLLLTEHRQGATLADLIVEFNRVKEDILAREHDVGFSGDTVDILFHAQRMLGDKIVDMTPPADTALQLDDEQLNTVKLVPVTSLPAVFELSYYANVASTVFAVESVLVNAIYVCVDAEQWSNHRHGIHIKVSRREVLEQATQLCSVLKYEYLFAPPCRTVDLVLCDAIDRLRNSDLLLSQSQRDEMEPKDDLNDEDRQWAKRFSRNLECGFEDSDDETWEVPDETYILSSEDDLLKKFWFLKHVLSPILETYYITACRLTLLQQHDMPESEFISLLHKLLKERVAEKLTCYAESAAIDTIRNAVHSFKALGVINSYEVAGVTMLSLGEAYGNDESLDDFIKHLESYRE